MNIMDFNVKKLAADAGTFLSRAVQVRSPHPAVGTAMTGLREAAARRWPGGSPVLLRLRRGHWGSDGTRRGCRAGLGWAGSGLAGQPIVSESVFPFPHAEGTVIGFCSFAAALSRKPLSLHNQT